jgi:GAF domain-containing protein
VLADASQAFAAAGRDYQGVLDQVVRQISEVDGDNCSIHLVSLVSDGEEWLQLAAMHDPDSDALAAARLLIKLAPIGTIASDIVPHVFRTGEPALMPVVTREYLQAIMLPDVWPVIEHFAPHSMIVVSLRLQGRSIGVLVLSRHRVGRPAFNEDDVMLAQDLANRAALAIENARLFGQAQAELA